MNLPIRQVKVKLEAGATIDTPWNDGRRSNKWNSWCCNIWTDPASPGGLGRKWLECGKGPYGYILPGWVTTGTVLEWGNDKLVVQHRKKHRERYRYYTVVLERTESHLLLLLYKRAKDALWAGKRVSRNGYSPAEVELALALGKDMT